MSSFIDTLKQLGPSRLAVMGAILLGLMLFFVFVSLRVSTPEAKLLYSDLSTEDAAAVAAKLQEEQINFTVSPDGSRIMVPDNDVGRARLLLAEAGLPNGGSMGYELFDKQSGFGTTNFVQNINQVRALEGELARTISSIDAVRSARVHLVLPQRELFARETRPSSASVYIGIKPGAQLEREQILAIQALVASAVPDLKPAHVTIIDSNGNLLASGTDEQSDVNLLTVKAEEMRRSFEARMTQKVEDQVSRIVGFGNVRAIITAEINFDRINTNEELFDPETQVVRSAQTTTENALEREPTPQDVSVQNNLPGVGGDLLVNDKPSSESNRTEEVTNFEISKTIRNTVREVGETRRLSVAVLVNGRFTTDKDGNKVYTERSTDEIQQIEDLVKTAVGFDDTRGDILTVKSLQFAEIDTNEDVLDESMLFGFEKADLIDAAEIFMIGIMIILVVLLVLQPMVSRLLTQERSETSDELEADLLAMRPLSPALTGPSDDAHLDELGSAEEESLINISGVDGKVKSSSIKKIEEIVENYPAETISVIRSWMAHEG